MPTEEEELYAQIEELKKKAEELKNKAKEIEEQNKDTEFNKQRNFLIDTVRNFLNMQVSDEEICAVLYKFYGDHINNQQNHIPISYYLKPEDENMLFERKVINRYAKCNEIRYEDSLAIISNFINKIKSINRIDLQQLKAKTDEQNRLNKINQIVNQIYSDVVNIARTQTQTIYNVPQDHSMEFIKKNKDDIINGLKTLFPDCLIDNRIFSMVNREYIVIDWS
jgi:hypothetical protein